METTMVGADEEDVEGNRLRNKAKNRNYKKSCIKNSSLERGERFRVSSEKCTTTPSTHTGAVNEKKIFSLDIFRPHQKKVEITLLNLNGVAVFFCFYFWNGRLELANYGLNLHNKQESLDSF